MKGRHRALIVEDDKATAEDLAEILRSIACDSVSVENYQDALSALRENAFCLVLLDLEIKHAPDAIKGHVEHGKSLLREIRQKHGDHAGVPFWLPVLIVSGFAREVSAAVDVMKDGASDVIQKPFKSQDVSETVRRSLETSGRLTHEVCGEKPAPRRSNSDRGILLTIPG